MTDFVAWHIYTNYIQIYANFILNLYLLFIYIRCKERGVVNGMIGRVKYCESDAIYIQNSSNDIIPVFPVCSNEQQYFPILASYAATIHKIVGQTLQHVTLVFDKRILSPAVGYVALSRVSSPDNVVPLLRLRKSHFINF